MPHPISFFLIDYTNKIRRGVEINEAPHFMHPFPVRCYLMLCMPKYIHHHRIVQHPLPVFLAQYERQSIRWIALEKKIKFLTQSSRDVGTRHCIHWRSEDTWVNCLFNRPDETYGRRTISFHATRI